ncbi:MAG: transketolase C-terminal domain-containing protein [Candidatus Firestonebacteria bacterium]
MKKVVEGSMAVAEFVKLCRPNVISAYPITPQTHIVENLAQIVADGELKAEFVNVESEHSAASCVLGASVAGARVYTATSSQGLLLMTEVLYNIAGMRLPIVLTCVNRSVSAPINIWNDWQDSISVRDSGWIQLYAETNQEAADMHIQAYKIAENPDMLIPVMVCMDGFMLSHSYEPIDYPEAAEVDKFLPPYKPLYYLDVKNPLTFGPMAGPELYAETRFNLHKTVLESFSLVKKTAEEFKNAFGRYYGSLIDTYKIEDADLVIVSMGSMLGTIKETVDLLREKGKKIGVLKIRCFRPFPKDEVRNILANKKKVAVIEKDISLGSDGVLYTEICSALYKTPNPPQIYGFVAGLGGRDVTVNTIMKAIESTDKNEESCKFIDVKE